MTNSTFNKRHFFYLTGFVGLSCLLWLVATIVDISGHNGSTDQPVKLADNSAMQNLLNEQKLSITIDLPHTKNALDEINGDANNIQTSVSLECSKRCDSTLSMLDQVIEFDDETFQKLAAYTEEIAHYLQNNKDQREHYTQIALTTSDADKRAYLTNIFKHLPEQQKVTIAQNFIASENWRLRADGVTLIADQGVSSLAMSSSLVDILLREENSYVKGSILNYLKNSAPLRGDTEVLQQLDSAIYNESNASVRVAAFKAKMQLSEQPYHILPDALQALRTNDPDFQLAGLVALEQVLRHEQEYTDNGAYIDKNSIKNEFEIIQNLTVYGEDKKRFESLIREANTIYLRYF